MYTARPEAPCTTPVPAVEQDTLARAADVLDRSIDTIVGHWVECVEQTVSSLKPEPGHREARDAAPPIVRGVAESLRRGQLQAQMAPWASASCDHTHARLKQGETLGDLHVESELERGSTFSFALSRTTGQCGQASL